MRIIVTADLHYDVARSREPTRALAQSINRTGGDVLLIVGDCVSTDLGLLDEVFGLFETFSGVKLFVAGNHELWTVGGGDSLRRYESELGEVCARNGIHYLDAAPYCCGDIAFVGSVGWYDYSFRSARLRIPLRFYREKVAPGAAAHLEKHRALLTPRDDVPDTAMEVTTRWMDGVRVCLPMSDVAFTHHLRDKLERHLEEAAAGARQVIAAVHHLPFTELVPRSILPNWEFANAFMGSELFGETLLESPRVSHVFCGHSHQPRRCRRTRARADADTLECINVGSTYTEKRHEILEV
jgi:predicted phosphohydrolase